MGESSSSEDEEEEQQLVHPTHMEKMVYGVVDITGVTGSAIRKFSDVGVMGMSSTDFQILYKIDNEYKLPVT